MPARCPDCGNQTRPGRFHACVDGRIRQDEDDRLTPKEAHVTTREDALTCQGCGVAVSLLVEIPNPTPEQVEDAKRFLALFRAYSKHGLVKLVPVEKMAQRKIDDGWRRTVRAVED